MTNIGIVIEHYSFRSDLRELLRLIQSHDSITIFCDESIQKQIQSDFRYNTKISYILTKEMKLLSNIFRFIGYKNKLWKEAFQWSLRKISGKKNIVQSLRYFFLLTEHFIPGFVSYDTFIKLFPKQKYDIPNLDAILFFTDIRSDTVVAYARQNNIPIFVYLYSWDHPVKIRRLPRMGTKYLVWNTGLKTDLVSINKIPEDDIEIVGSTQLSIISEYKNSCTDLSAINDAQFLYFIATKGRPEFVAQELDLFERIAAMALEKYPNLKLVYRPYPNVSKSSLNQIECLHNYPNVEIDNYFDHDHLLTFEKKFEKYKKMCDALVVIHTGGTIAVEAGLLKVNSIYYNFSNELDHNQQNVVSYLRLSNVNKQHHLRKFVNRNYSNVCGSWEELCSLIDYGLVNNISSEYNDWISSQFEYEPLELLVSKIYHVIKINSVKQIKC